MKSTKLKVVKAYTDQREEKCLVQFLMELTGDIEGLHDVITNLNPLPSVDSVFNELLAEEIRPKSLSNFIPHKGLFSTPPYVFNVPFHKEKPKGRVGFSIEECSICKEKCH